MLIYTSDNNLYKHPLRTSPQAIFRPDATGTGRDMWRQGQQERGQGEAEDLSTLGLLKKDEKNVGRHTRKTGF